MMVSSSRSTSTPPMNRYGAMAWEHWERHRPRALAAMADPVSFFRALGELVEAEVTAETTVRLDPVQATDPAQVAMVRREVEEEILAAHVLLPAETDPTPSPHEDPDLVEEIPVSLNDPILQRLRGSPIIEPPS